MGLKSLSNFAHCDRPGGSLKLIDGFVGKLNCPKAEDFCLQQAITGIRYEGLTTSRRIAKTETKHKNTWSRHPEHTYLTAPF